MFQPVASAGGAAQSCPVRRLTRAQLKAAAAKMVDLQNGWIPAVQKSYNGDLSLELHSADPARDETFVIFSDDRGVLLGMLNSDHWETLGIYAGLAEALTAARNAVVRGGARMELRRLPRERS